jgi:hypothetical protein
MILFLDFDGVLHSEYIPGATPSQNKSLPEDFSQLPVFEAVMREFRNLRIVISSSWRQRYSLDELKAMFSEDIRHQIIDVTPTLPRRSEGHRQREIEAWMQRHAEGGEWIALDDWPPLFDQDCSDVFFTETLVGLDVQAAEQLRHWIQEKLNQTLK